MIVKCAANNYTIVNAVDDVAYVLEKSKAQWVVQIPIRPTKMNDEFINAIAKGATPTV